MLQHLAALAQALDGQLLLAALVAAAVLLITSGVRGLLMGRDAVEQRLAGPGAPADGAGPPSLRLDADGRKLKRFARYLTPADALQRTAMRERMARAGYRNPGAIRVYYLLRAALGLGAALAAAVALPLLRPDAAPIAIMLGTGLVALVGYLLPAYWIMRRIQGREEQVRNGFPDTLDMLLVCIEAGQGLDAALARVAAEVERAHPVLADELSLVGHELRAGKERSEVLRSYARRCGVDDVSAFVTVLIQSDQFGTSIASALRVYAAEMRKKRLMRAEEKANKLPVKLALGTMAFTVPPVLLILIGPSIIMVLRALAGFMR